MKLNRRRFLESLGFALLSVQVLPLGIVKAETAEEPANDNLLVRSGESKFFPAEGHLHDLLIPMALIKDPPTEGTKLTTSTAFLHKHKVVLSQAQLTAIAQGETVTVPDTVNDHDYVISLLA